MKGVLPWLVPWARRAGKNGFLSRLGCSSRPSTKYFFHTGLYFTLFVVCPHCPASWAGSRATSPSLNKRLW